jgi:hypothetical protein
MIVQTLKQQIMGNGNIVLVPLPTGIGGARQGVSRSNSDTMSTASTCTTVEATIQRKSSIRKTPSSMIHHKCVRFAPQLEVVLAHVLHRSDMSDQDIDDRFLMQKDVMAIRAHAKLTTKYYRLKDPKMMHRLDACYDQTATLVGKAISDGPNTVSETTLRRCVDLIDRTAADEWCGRQKFHGRGLERYCSEHQRTVRARTIAMSRQHTVQAQDDTGDHDTAAEELAAVYRKWTRTAVVFALVMAQADHRAASDGELSVLNTDEDNNNNNNNSNNNDNRILDIDNVDDDRLNETGRIVLQPVAVPASTTRTSRPLSPQKSPSRQALPRRKPSLLRRFKSTGAA